MEGIKKGKIKVEILVKDIEKILNILWLQNIPAKIGRASCRERV